MADSQNERRRKEKPSILPSPVRRTGVFLNGATGVSRKEVEPSLPGSPAEFVFV
jgi:hypothetical protein